MTGEWLLLALAYPAVLINVGHGQNGFLTAALLGGALLMLDRRPLMAGILFGLLVYKPQYGLMIPLVLAVSGRWRIRFIAAAKPHWLLLTIATTLSFGVSAWHAFAVFSEFTRTVVLEQGNTGWYKIQSVFAWARMWGARRSRSGLCRAGCADHRRDRQLRRAGVAVAKRRVLSAQGGRALHRHDSRDAL